MSGTSRHGLVLAVMAGTMAALGSVFAKLAFDETLSTLCTNLIVHDITCGWVTLVSRVVCFMSVFGSNGLMWILFTKSMQYSISTVEATVTNTASNFLVTAILGCLIFGEVLSPRWFMGSVFIVCGLLLIHRSGDKEKAE
ncbi:hypothetical protein FSP39_015316 [Pinctada imbricata]|uniref:EamA domain-containing protein n=1 Tax=Pinctada imbricata TaxID=66713 RepID=A0AA88XRK0_PINIB|nr:hypothetical protein FSP39_015316 [Pinctada imbricata]